MQLVRGGTRVHKSLMNKWTKLTGEEEDHTYVNITYQGSCWVLTNFLGEVIYDLEPGAVEEDWEEEDDLHLARLVRNNNAQPVDNPQLIDNLQPTVENL